MTDKQPEIEALREALRERRDLFTLAAHELRNPLHGLALQLGLASARAQATGDAETLRFVAAAQTQLARYTARVTTLIDLLGFDDGAVRPSPRLVDLAATLADAVTALEADAALRGLHLTADLPDACAITTDPLAIGQAVDSLLQNALRHSGGHHVVLRLRQEAPHALIEVCDDGAGLDDKTLARVLPAHGTLPATGPSSHPAGFGLWTARRLVAALGGELSYRHAPGNGACFVILLPLANEPSAMP